jgi:endoglycosylceramidase
MSFTTRVLCTLLISLTFISFSFAALDRIKIQNRQLVDSYNRVRQFHGINIVNKTLPYLSNFVTQAQVQEIANEWGFNVVRTGFMWDGYEHVQGVTSQSYLQNSINIMNNLYAANGIYSLWDIHQDIFSAGWCGDGFPNWAAILDAVVEAEAPFPLPVVGSTPYPLVPGVGINTSYCLGPLYQGDYYLTPAVGDIWANFYANTDGVQTQFINMFSNLAKNLAGNPNLLGYEIINEPFPGNIYVDGNLLANSTYADLTLLAPLYDAVSVAVRKYDQQGLLFFEPLVTNGEVIPRTAGFTHPPGNTPNLDVLSFHVYCDVNPTYQYECYEVGGAYAGQCASINDPGYCNDIFFPTDFEVRNADAQALNVPMFITEFGSFYQNATVDDPINELIVDLASQYLASWVNWDILYVQANPNIIPVIVRPYAQAIAGQPLSESFNRTTGLYVLNFTINKSITAPTEIFIPITVHYPKGVLVSISPANVLSYYYPTSYLINFNPTIFSKQGEKVTITITPDGGYLSAAPLLTPSVIYFIVTFLAVNLMFVLTL